MPPGVLLFVATTFASAFLIFLVQPIVAKSILPWFGGVPAVWSLCLAFYQTTLFAGYAYAHAIMVGGIIVLAVAIDLTIAHPTAAAGTAPAAVTLGAPALYLVGDGLFKYAISGRTPWPRIGGALALALLAPLALVADRLELSAAAALVVVALAVAQIWTRPDRVQAA